MLIALDKNNGKKGGEGGSETVGKGMQGGDWGKGCREGTGKRMKEGTVGKRDKGGDCGEKG